ncbi:PREDICTED: inactive tyrosine-protein kinase transmembrane receptor ROR1-like [Priapulus caudatus]|uniref:Tyrosine-protein kinase receptor n=1 Tax=Priapulus caudatus TaxID=37621 RepID=A0ABM1E7J3_PRICU|nr:PREDICTED: inactive tyrosine-protein kinase transmembrane receptor ROR1-like [Priapulus caudatus]
MMPRDKKQRSKDEEAGALTTAGTADASEMDGDEGEAFCQKYRGSACARFVGNKSIYVTSKYSMFVTDDKMSSALALMAMASELSESCRQFAIPSLCYHAFPLCDESSSQPRPLKICKDECEILETDICEKEYSLAQVHPVLKDKVILPRCSELPDIGTPEAHNCIRIGIPKANPVNMAHTCYNGSGESYRGSASVTRSGLPCQKWKANYPHQHLLTASDYPELSGGHSYCRNPGGRESAPYCFTLNENVRTEACDIPKCVGGDGGMEDIMYMLIPAIAIPVLLIIIIAIYCACRRRKASANRRQGRTGNPLELSPLNGKLKNPVRAREFAMTNIRFQQELGEGAFGKVYKGELMGLNGDVAITQVAVKTLKENASPKIQQDFRREVDLMTDLRHPNIVCLIGVCIKEEPMCMLFEFMAQGDLHEFLVMRSPHSDVSMSSGEDNQHLLDHADFFYIAIQISAGMEYLSSRHFVHRDLAARNCLVGDQLTIKISDFGLSRDIYSSDYYRVQSKSLLPVRWMPPEAILYGKFSMESDVWSYGVVLWEIFSYGLQPYYGYNNQEVIEMVRGHQILPCPDDCPARVYALMVECWHEVPTRRPSFKELYARLRAWDAGNAAAAAVALAGGSVAHSSSTQHSSNGPSVHTGSTNLSASQSPPPAGLPQHPAAAAAGRGVLGNYMQSVGAQQYRPQMVVNQRPGVGYCPQNSIVRPYGGGPLMTRPPMMPSAYMVGDARTSNL